MKKHVIFYFAFLLLNIGPFLIPHISKSLYTVHASPQFNDIWAPGGLDEWAIAVGNEGTIVKLYNYGMIFNVIDEKKGYNLTSVFFINSNTGWASANNKSILKTTDGGESWLTIPITISVNPNLNSIYFHDANTGWVAGGNGTILKTIDGGNNWTDYSHGTEKINSIYFHDENIGWAAGEGGTILKTTDGGQNWSDRFGGTQDIVSLHFYDNSIGWAVGNKTETTGGKTSHYFYIYKTTNGGDTWDPQRDGNGIVNSIYFIDENSGWIVKQKQYKSGGYDQFEGTKILYTINGGNDWWTTKVKEDLDLKSIYIANDISNVKKGWVCGEGGVVLHSNNADDKKWGHVIGETLHKLHSVFFVDANTGWIVGEKGTIMKTTDGGEWWHWQHNEESSVIDANTQQIKNTGSDWFLSCYFLNANQGWVCGSRGVILSTGDGGNTWAQIFDITYLTEPWPGLIEIDNVPEEFRLECIYFINNLRGWAVGEDGLIITTTNGGTNWQIQNSGTNDRLESIYFFDQDNGWAVGRINKDGTKRDKQILETSNSGNTWNKIDVPTEEWLSSVYCPNPAIVYAVGSIGTIIKSNDWGNIWNEISSGFLPDGSPNHYGTPLWLESVFFPSPDIGYAVGGGFMNEPAILFKTIDAGVSFIDQRPFQLYNDRVVREALTSVYFIDNFIGWAVGNKGTILKTTNGGGDINNSGWFKLTTHQATLKDPKDHQEAEDPWKYSEIMEKFYRE